MKHFKLFFALFAMLALNVGNAWGAEETESYTCAKGTIVDNSMTWNLTSCTIEHEKAESSNELAVYAPWRIYAKQTITITPKSGITITKMVITSTSDAYATAGTKTWTNATATSSSTSITVIPTDGTSKFVYTNTNSGQTRWQSVVITYTSGGTEPPTPTTQYTIKWHTAKGVTTDVTLNEGATINKPDDPTMTGYEFMGWTTDCSVASDGSDFTALTDFGTADSDKDFYAVFAVATTTGGGTEEKEFTFNITKEDFNTTSYAANNNEKTSTAKASDGSTTDVKWTSNQVMQSSSVMQWQKDKGYIYNSTDLGTITNIEITSTAGSFTKYINNSKQPTSNGTGGYFQIKIGGATGKSSNIKVTFTQTVEGGGTTTYSDYITTCASGIEYIELGDAFKWSTASAEVTIDATDNVFPSLTNTHKVPVTYSSSDDAIASISSDGSTVTLNKEGTVTITAKYAGGTPAGTGKEYKAKTVDYTLTVKPAPLEPIAGGVIDILDNDWSGLTTSDYATVTAKTAANTGHSNAQYTAQCAGSNSSIQLRSNNSNSGIVSTVSGGLVKRVEIEWNDETSAGRTLNIYGSNTPYTNPTDLYDTNKDGDKLGTIVKGTSTHLEISEDYRYIGLRSASGAMYLTKVTITWLPINSKVSIDDAIQHGSISVSGATDLNAVAAGTELTLDNNPTTGYKLAAYDVYKTDDATTKVTVTDGKFIMPEFDVTISATFELAKTLTNIEITTPATQTTFWQGEAFNSTGLKVTAHFDGAADEDVTDKVTVTGSTTTAGNQTVTVSYKEGEVTKDATYTITNKAIPNTKETAYTVADAFDIIDKLGDTDKMYITGFVSQADLVQSNIDQYKNADYWISADGSTNGQQLEAYRGKYLDNADFTSVNQIMVGDEVIIYGKLTKYGSTYEFAAGNYLVSLKREKQQAGLAYATTEYSTTLGESFETPTLTNPYDLTVTYSSDNTSAVDVNEETGEVTIKAVGKAKITATFAGNSTYAPGSASYTITVTGVATLPFEFDGKQANIEVTPGMSHKGIDAEDYNNSPYLKMNTTGDWLIVHFDGQPDKLTYDIKNNSFNGGTFSVLESADGETYTDVAVHTTIEGTQSEEHTLLSTSRYVKFIYTKKVDGNVGLGNIKITKLDIREEAGLAWSTTSYNTYDGDETPAPTLTNPYVLNITYSSSNEDVATIDGAGKLTLKNTGTTTITATFEGNENYKASEVSYTLSYASKWALTYTSNVKVGTNTVMINDTEYEAIKTGTSTVHGSTKVTVPASTHTLHFHAAGWGKDEDVKLIVKNGETELGTFVLSKDAGVKNSSPFILEGTPYLQYYSVALTNITEEATITFEASTTGGERFVLYGVNQEGGVLPELNRIEIVGEAIELEYEIGDEFNPTGLSVNAIYTLAGVEHETVAVDTEDVEWSFDPATIAAETSQVEVTATYEGKTATKTVTGLTVIIPEPEILVTPQTVSFNASQNQSIDTKTISITLKNVTSATVSLTGDGASAFNIDKTQFTESGSLTITPNTSKVGTFKAAITIADDAGVAESKKVTLTLNVTTTDNLNGTWSLITDASNLKANIKVIIASAADSEIIYTMGAQNTNNRAAIQSSVVENTLKPELGTKVFTLVNAGDGKFAIKAINGNYLYAASNSANQLKEKDEIDVNGLWTITIADNKATIKAEGSSNRNWIRFNPNNGTPLFSCYASGQEDIYLYTTHVTVNETTDNTSIPNQSDVTVDNAELTVTTEAEYDNMYIGDNGTVKVVNEVTVNNLYISTTMGATTSGQLSTTPENLNVTGDVFIDITLGKNGDPNQWHAFTVPFPVDAMNGVYDLNDNKLTNEVNYAIMDYHGDLRANGQYGWKKYRGILVPGTFYLMTVDGERDTYRFKKVEDAAIVAPATKAITAYTGTGDATKDKGWNGVGNPTLMHGKVGYKALILNPESYTYEAIPENTAYFTVGTPFFIQAATDGTMTMDAEPSASLAPARRAAAAVENIKVMLGNSDYTDRLYVSASEDAINEYEIGKDLGKMAMTSTPSVVQISALAYDTRLCMIDAPMANNEALVALNLYAPANGEYTLCVEAQDNEKVYLLHEGTFVWDLSMSEYPITLNKGDNAGYSILVHRVDAPTSVETIDGTNNQTEKLIHNGNLYILHNGKVFDAVGTMLK